MDVVRIKLWNEDSQTCAKGSGSLDPEDTLQRIDGLITVFEFDSRAAAFRVLMDLGMAVVDAETRTNRKSVNGIVITSQEAEIVDIAVRIAGGEALGKSASAKWVSGVCLGKTADKVLVTRVATRDLDKGLVRGQSRMQTRGRHRNSC